MAKIVIVNDNDPAIGVTLEEVLPGTAGRPQGFYGTCTECGWPMHRWYRGAAIDSAKRHVDRHNDQAIGEDVSNWVRR